MSLPDIVIFHNHERDHDGRLFPPTSVIESANLRPLARLIVAAHFGGVLLGKYADAGDHPQEIARRALAAADALLEEAER